MPFVANSAPPPGADHLLVVLSDIEMGAGGVTDDFPHPEWLGELVLQYAAPPFDTVSVDFVFNGDTFDLLKTALDDGTYPTHITAELAVQKWERIERAHGPFLDALRLALQSPNTRALFVYGNHDQDLMFPQVQERVRERLGGERVLFPGFGVSIGDCWIEHGSQQDSLFRVEPDQPFIDIDGQLVLNLPWGATTIIEAMLPYQPVLYHQERCKPRERVLELLPEVREFLLERTWNYWTNDYVSSWLSGRDPLKKLDWTMFREVVYRYATDDAGVHIGGDWVHRMQTDPLHRIFLLGHEHKADWTSWTDRKVLRTGAMRNEYVIGKDGIGHTVMPKVYAHVWQKRFCTVSSELVEVTGPELPEGYCPSTLYEVLGPVRRLQTQLQTEVMRERARAEREAQERRETRGRFGWPFG